MIWEPRPNCEHEVFKVLAPAIRFKREDCVDIPDLQSIVKTIDMSPQQAKAYEDIRKDLLHDYDLGLITAVNAGVTINKLLQIASGWVKDDLGNVLDLNPKARLEALLDIYKSLEIKKLIVFTPYRASVAGVTAFLQCHGINAHAINGDTKSVDRGNMIRRFQDADIQVLVIQPRTASHGITLTASNTIVWYGLDWSGETYQQANGRISRIGQTRKQLIVNFVGSPAEKRVLSLLGSKQTRADDLLGLFKDHAF